MIISDVEYEGLLTLRLDDPAEMRRRLVERSRPSSLLGGDGNLCLIAADHVARGETAVGGYPMAMANRRDLLERIMVGLSVEGCNGVIGSADILEELAALGALEDRVAIGTMNRGGLADASWAMNDRHTAYGPKDVHAANLHGGKMLLRIHEAEDGTGSTLELCGRYISALAARELIALVEPVPYETNQHGQLVASAAPERLIRALTVASGLGASSAYTWLKLPVSPQIETVMAATTLPSLILGAVSPGNEEAALSSWKSAMRIANVRGMIVGRSLLYPADGDVMKASRQVAQIVHG